MSTFNVYFWSLGFRLIQATIEKKTFLIALNQVEVVGENKVPW